MLNKFLNKRIRLIAVIYLSALLFLILLFTKQLTPVSDIIYGGSSYNISLGKLAPYGIIIRGLWYLLAFITSAALMLLVPRCRMFFTSYGGRTLQIYMSHIWCRNILVYVGFFEIIHNVSPWIALLVLIGSIGLTFLLSNGLSNRLFNILAGKRVIEKIVK
jgi:fucose 4-O-acetylase-like acetyltransferase